MGYVKKSVVFQLSMNILQNKVRCYTLHNNRLCLASAFCKMSAMLDVMKPAQNFDQFSDNF